MLPSPPRQWPHPGRLNVPGSPTSGPTEKWSIRVAVLLVLTLVTVVTHQGMPRNAAPPPPATPASPAGPPADASQIASAEDEDPVSIVTDDPTCPEWEPITAALNTELGNGWHQRDPSIPQTEWTDDQHTQYRAVAVAMRAAADKSVALAKQTPHRVMRELYEQAIAYWRAYADTVDNYRPSADHLAGAATSAAESIQSICAAIDFGAAAGRAALTLPGPPPVPESPLADPAHPPRFITGASAFCSEWVTMVGDYDAATREWRDRHDPNLPASQSPPDLRELNAKAATVMQQNADRTQLQGLLSGNLTAADFAALSSHYRRAYAMALPSYGLPDTHLDDAASRLQSLTDHACRAVRK